MPSTQRQPPLRFTGVQALRGVAALLVVIFHALEAWNIRSGKQPIAWPNGMSGVDIFFVISGFVMTLSVRRLGMGDGAWRRFAADRLRRIVPLYWIFSAAKIAAVSAVPALALRTKLTIPFVAASFLLLPLHDANGAFKPLLPVGWTLTFEMLFYVLFAAGLKLRLNSPLWVVAPLAALALLPHNAGSAWGELCNPILIEFAFGIVLAKATERGWIVPSAWAVPILAAASAAILLGPINRWGGRVVVLGVPAALILVTVVALELRTGLTIPRTMLLLGDASYAIYLSHGFVIPILALGLRHYAVPGPIELGAWIAATILASSLAGWAIHVAIEKPLLRLLKIPGNRRVSCSPSIPLTLQFPKTAPQWPQPSRHQARPQPRPADRAKAR